MPLDSTATISMLAQPLPSLPPSQANPFLSLPPSLVNSFPFFESQLRHHLLQEALHDAELPGHHFSSITAQICYYNGWP